ncbi:MAG: tetraacyldisaccharide 4'-kinase [Gammaproteobacteria bacterium]|nr:tetraacyldisaccharide 4'-kinase [Gammaproteobacteria bacterium]
MTIQDHWYHRTWLSRLLLPVAYLFGAITASRRALYRWGMLHSFRAPVPVVVVGNISVGGTGKTPLVVYLAGVLAQSGYRVGVVSRGHGGSAAQAQEVSAQSPVTIAGDEALLIARNCDARIWVGRQRSQAVAGLLEKHPCDVVLSDDGLQHYALQRDVEIAVVDGARRMGNGWLLPAGPLRETPSRLRQAHMVVVNGDDVNAPYAFQLQIEQAVNLVDGETRSLVSFRDTEVHAVAGIGHPARFFMQLQELGLTCREHAFPDHHRFRAADFAFADELPVLMTEKDAVKCAAFDDARLWYVPAALLDRESHIAEAVKRLLKERAAH